MRFQILLHAADQNEICKCVKNHNTKTPTHAPWHIYDNNDSTDPDIQSAIK
jgi:hypothetical protein